LVFTLVIQLTITVLHRIELYAAQHKLFHVVASLVLWQMVPVLLRIVLLARQHKLFPCGYRSRAMANGHSFASYCAFSEATQTVHMWLTLSCYGQRSQFCFAVCFPRRNTNCLCEFPIHVSRLTASVLHRIKLSAMQHKLFPSVSHSRIMGNGLSFAPHCVSTQQEKLRPCIPTHGLQLTASVLCAIELSAMQHKQIPCVPCTCSTVNGLSLHHIGLAAKQHNWYLVFPVHVSQLTVSVCTASCFTPRNSSVSL
jgi:hypothetical protein